MNIKYIFLFKICGLFLFWFSLISGCGANPDLGEAPGTCPLNCEGAIIASTDMTILPFTKKIEINCQGIAPDSDYSNIVPIRFSVVKKPSDSSSTNLSLKQEEPEEGTDGEGKTAPVSGISFEVLVAGGELSTQPNPEDERSKYNGIITPKSDWCTDSCGVGAVDIVPLCKAKENVVNLVIHSGAVPSSVEIKVSP